MNSVFEAIRDNGVIPALKVFSADEAVAAEAIRPIDKMLSLS